MPVLRAERLASQIAALRPHGVSTQLPDPDVSWEPRERPRVEATAELEALRMTILAMPRPQAVGVAVEGLCRVIIGGDRGGRGGERFTAVVVHVIADGEPARLVFLPTE